MGRYLRTSDLAKAVSVHPNTVRLYEAWGFLPAVPRSPGGYRLFTEAHLDQMRLARTALRCAWLGRGIRTAALACVHRSAAGDLNGALEEARQVLSGVQREQAQAEAAAHFLETWAVGGTVQAEMEPVRIGEAARFVGATADMLRNWERNGLLQVPRDPQSGYRLYGSAQIGRLRVIRTLLRSGYSTMAVLRAMLRLDQGNPTDLRQVLDTPAPDEPGMGYGEDAYYATDRWLTTLSELEQHARQAIGLLEEMIRKRSG